MTWQKHNNFFKPVFHVFETFVYFVWISLFQVFLLNIEHVFFLSDSICILWSLVSLDVMPSIINWVVWDYVIILWAIFYLICSCSFYFIVHIHSHSEHLHSDLKTCFIIISYQIITPAKLEDDKPKLDFHFFYFFLIHLR